MPNNQYNGTRRINIRDVNPLEHLTADLAKARFNYESILKGLVEWNASKLDNVTVRLMCDAEPGFVDYTFPTKKEIDRTGANVADPDSWENSYSFGQRYPISALISSDSQYNDKVDIRINVIESAGATWKLCMSAVLYDEQHMKQAIVYNTHANIIHSSESDGTEGNIITHDEGADASSDYIPGQFIRINYPETAYAAIRWVTIRIVKHELILDSNTNHVIERWNLDRVSEYRNSMAINYLFVVYDGKVYRPVATVNQRTPATAGSGWEYYCDVYSGEGPLEHGKVYMYDPDPDDTEFNYGEFFVYTGDDTVYAYPPYEIVTREEQLPERVYNDGWSDPSVLLIPISENFDSTNAIRWTATTDIDSLVLLRTGEGTADKVPEIDILPSVRIVGGTTEDNGGLAIFDTSNYSEWPGVTPKWSMDSNYVTDTTKSVGEKQNYTASMIFDHANPNCKECNIVNYDGPDLDRGLAIYLPVESVVDEKLVYPKNGRTFEFLFRIWPNPAYNGHEAAGLIINKAQIYVYSVPDRSSIGCSAAPIAKFSMARLTNFYVFSENIAVPNRPVLIKAKFVYSEEEQSWKTYDYYQLPDCIFLSPDGFVDPNRPSDDPSVVETAGFPLVQDPFSSYDLSPVIVDGNYSNRIE